jgi:subfamily B ATP-binding cassette protein MsbA
MAKINLGRSLGLYKKLWAYMNVYWKRFLISVIAMIITAATEPAFARIMKPLIDNGFINQEKSAIILTPLLVMLIFLIRAISSYINETNSTWLSATIVEKMRNLMFNKVLRLPIEYYSDNNSGRIISRIVFDVTQITEAGFNVITVTIRDGITIICLLGLLFYTDWQLTLFCFFTLPFVLILVRYLAYKLRKLTSNNQQQYGNMTQIITESVAGQKVVKLYSGYNYEEMRFKDSIATIKDNNVKQTSVSSLNSGLSQFLVACALAMILYFAASKSKVNNFTAGDFVSFITAMLMIFAPMKRITNVTQSLQKGLSAAESVFSFLEIKEEYDMGDNEFKEFNDQIEFKNLSFRYLNSEENVLTNFNLVIKKGETIALVGSSGSGKTTLANLLPRFYQPTNGQILFDGVDYRDIKLEDLRGNISLVSQDVVLFNDSVFNNIAYGHDLNKINVENVIHAAKMANAYDFIMELNDGFDTLIGENGTKLSGGQKQRIAIARAILKNSPILILDEATSALDNRSEKIVQEALERLTNSKTTIIIAHRLSTIKHADKIIVLEKGQIVEVGKHQELLKLNKYYAYLYNLIITSENSTSSTDIKPE